MRYTNIDLYLFISNWVYYLFMHCEADAARRGEFDTYKGTFSMNAEIISAFSLFVNNQYEKEVELKLKIENFFSREDTLIFEFE